MPSQDMLKTFLERRCAAVRRVRYIPTYPPPAGTHYQLKLTVAQSAERLQPSYSDYGTERVRPAGGPAASLARQEQTAAWQAATQGLGIHLDSAVNLPGIWSLIWHNAASVNMGVVASVWGGNVAPIISVVRRDGCLATVSAGILDGTVVRIEAAFSGGNFRGRRLPLALRVLMLIRLRLSYCAGVSPG